jgi:hypothetical protein
MNPIQDFEIDEGLDILFRTPQIKNLNTKEELRNISTTFMKGLYLEQPKEVLNYFKYKLNDRMITTIFKNYGIEEIYYKDLNPLITRNLVYYLEYLFQTKGSLETFNVFNELFSSFYNSIDFYNVTVSKVPVASGRQKIAYILKPLKLSSEKQKRFFPSSDINLSGKYLMSLNQYHQYKFFPIDTNMIYIDFANSYKNGNNYDIFIQGIRAYTNTMLQSTFVSLVIPSTGLEENIYLNDIELILAYTQYRLIKMGDEDSQKNFDFELRPMTFETPLTLPIEVLPEIEDVLRVYKDAKYWNRTEMKSLKRKWQYLLNNYKEDNTSINNFTEFEDYIKLNYPKIFSAINNFTKVDDYMNLYIQMYGTILEKIDKDNEYLAPYYNSVFQSVISGNLFIKNFFQPLFKIFVKYFFPASMDYTQQVGSKVNLKDKWNSISTEIDVHTNINIGEFSPYLHCTSIYAETITSKILEERFYYFNDVVTVTNKTYWDTLTYQHRYIFNISAYFETQYFIDDLAKTNLLLGNKDQLPNIVDKFDIQLSTNIYDKYLVDLRDAMVLNMSSKFQEKNYLSSRNREEQMPVDILIKRSDQNVYNETFDLIRRKGSFYTTNLTLDEYIYMKSRTTGLTSAGLTPLDNYEILKEDTLLASDTNINTYLFYTSSDIFQNE